jgi:hypothetical protein
MQIAALPNITSMLPKHPRPITEITELSLAYGRYFSPRKVRQDLPRTLTDNLTENSYYEHPFLIGLGSQYGYP